MKLKAVSIGELASKTLSRGGRGEVTRVFQRSAYLKSGTDFVLLLWGGLRSPLTINLGGNPVRGSYSMVGEPCFLSQDAVAHGLEVIEVGEADHYRTPLRRRGTDIQPSSSALRKGVSMLRSLYDASPSGPTLVEDAALRSFVEKTLIPFTLGRESKVFSPLSYVPLIGRGGGFTPAGDDDHWDRPLRRSGRCGSAR